MSKHKTFKPQPRNRTLAAFKAWIRGITRALNPQAPETMTEAMWETAWRKFWAERDAAQQ